MQVCKYEMDEGHLRHYTLGLEMWLALLDLQDRVFRGCTISY